MSADAVTKAAESLAELGLPSGQRERLSRILLNAIDYYALKDDRDRLDEILGEAEEMLAEYHEAIGRYVPDGIRVLLAERDRYRQALERLARNEHSFANPAGHIARDALEASHE